MSHHEWLMRLFTERILRKIDLNPKIKGLLFLQHDIQILCENTHVQLTVWKINALSVQRPSKLHIVALTHCRFVLVDAFFALPQTLKRPQYYKWWPFKNISKCVTFWSTLYIHCVDCASQTPPCTMLAPTLVLTKGKFLTGARELSPCPFQEEIR